MKRILIAITVLMCTEAYAGQCSETYKDAQGVERRRPIACDGTAEPKPAPLKGQKKDPVAK